MTLIIDNDVRSLLLQQPANEADVLRWLAGVGFADWQAAYQSLQRIANSPVAQTALADSLPNLLTTLATTSQPNQVLVNFERFAQNADNQVALFNDFAQNPRTLEILVTLFEGSQFLTEILLRHPHYFDRLTAHHRFSQPKTADQFHHEAQAILDRFTADTAAANLTPALDALRRFHRWELLRIGAADLLGSFDLLTVISQLSHLADSLIRASLSLAGQHTGTSTEEFIIIAMGKLGGQELNYSSDIDLLFLVPNNASTYYRLGQQVIDGLTRVTNEGFLYRVDMRLRPWGRTGALVTSLDAYQRYLEKHARLWEKQALLKARAVTGHQATGRKFLRQIQPLLFDMPADEIRREVHALKQRIETQLRQRGREWGQVKLGEGSIRDIEFVTQYLQLSQGGQNPSLRQRSTLEALRQLFKANCLTPEEYRVLTDGYIFLRTIEHHLQLMHYQQTHTLPDDPAALNYLAHRLGFEGKDVGQRFITQYQQHTAVIRLVYQHQFGQTEEAEPAAEADPAERSSKLLPHVVRMHPSYVATFSGLDIEHHANLILQLDDEHQVLVEAIPMGEDYWQITIVGYDYIGLLSLICGLLFVYGFNIVEGQVFSYGESVEVPDASRRRSRKRRRVNLSSKSDGRDSRRKIVDVFMVRPVSKAVETDCWSAYRADLAEFMQRLQAGEQREAQGELAKRFAKVLGEMNSLTPTLYPVDIEIDNEAARNHTVLRIDAPDTVGFLYEFTNALALSNINIRRMTVGSVGNRVQDTLYVTDAAHQKITSLDKQRELRVTTALIKHFTHLLPRSPNPESALLHFREFVTHLFNQKNWPKELASLEQPEVLSTLARLLGVSDFLWDDFLRMQHANLFPVVQDVAGLSVSKSKAELREELEIELQQTHDVSVKQDILNAFKDREMFRIDMRQIQGHITEFGQFSSELTDLAEIVVEAAYRIAAQALRQDYGLPRLTNRRVCPVTICALGKAGGRELGFASDIELMVIYAGNGRTTGRRVITTAEFFNKLVFQINSIIRTKREGIFELDLQLRPYGKAGSMGVSLESFEQYFAPDGDAWPYERQALVKLRPIAGDVKLGQQVINLRDAFLYNGTPFDVAAMRAMRERQIRHWVTAGTINAKLSPGGLVDIEYLVQGLQITHGHDHPALRQSNTRQAMAALAEAQIIPPEDYLHLRQALNFLRQLINALRMVRGNTKDLTVPLADSEEFAFLARRLLYEDKAKLQDDLVRHTTTVQEINQRLLG